MGRELERQWEEALRHAQHEHEAYARFCRAQPTERTLRERDTIRRVAQDLPGLWAAPETTAQDRQEIVRVLLEQVTVDVQGDSKDPRRKRRGFRRKVSVMLGESVPQTP